MEQHIAANKRRTFCLISLMVVFLVVTAVVFASLFEAPGAAIILILVLTGFFLYNYFRALHRIVKLSGSKPVTKRTHRELYLIVENYSIGIGIPPPKIYIIKDPALNAFAAGNKIEDSIIGVTKGLLEKLNRQELEGVIAHELSHIINRDAKVNTLTFALVAVFGLLLDSSLQILGRRSRGPLLLIAAVLGIVGYIAALLIRLSVSRQREYLADATGAQITRYPQGLLKALEKIAHHGSILGKKNQHSSISHFFFSPSMEKILSTHPPLKDRIERIKKIQATGY